MQIAEAFLGGDLKLGFLNHVDWLLVEVSVVFLVLLFFLQVGWFLFSVELDRQLFVQRLVYLLKVLE